MNNFCLLKPENNPLIKNSTSSLQLIDDFSLLECMIRDLREASPLYCPTNYWANFEKPILDELRSNGLFDLRRREITALSGFVGNECVPVATPIELQRFRLLFNRITCRVPGWQRLLQKFSLWLSNAVGGIPHYDIDRPAAHFLISRFITSLAHEVGSVPITELNCSLVGNPDDIIEVDGKPYTQAFLSQYVRYVYMSQFIDLTELNLIVELGPGIGQFAEIIHQINPSATILLFDIPPTLYVAEQYLSATFSQDLVGYRNTRNFADNCDLEPGKIFIFGSFDFPIVGKLKDYLFINCGSFQEMEPEIVRNYLSFVESTAECVYIRALRDGKSPARGPGYPGVLRSTNFSVYLEALSKFDCINFSDAINISGYNPLAKDAIFRKKSSP